MSTPRNRPVFVAAIAAFVIAAAVGGAIAVGVGGGDSCTADRSLPSEIATAEPTTANEDTDDQSASDQSASGDTASDRTAADNSVARLWNEQTLNAIRRDFPAPTVHARNLFHLSAAMWDAWLITSPADPGQPAFVSAADLTAAGLDVPELGDADRDTVVSYAAYRLLTHRYVISSGADDTLPAFDAQMERLCLDPDLTALDPGSPAAVGVAIAESIIDETRLDGSNEPSGYVDLSYAPVNAPMVVSEPGTEMVDPNRWQPLSLDNAVTRNGQALASGIQEFVGPNWGSVAPFALEGDSGVDGLPIDPGPPPLFGLDGGDDAEFADRALEVVRYASLLDADAPTAEARDLADYGRVIAEYWADGPDSETPPGHWNTIAHLISDRLAEGDGAGLRIAGTGDVVERLEWDVKLGLALNGALHDAAIAAWGAKAHYDYVRPISMIRYLAAIGELPLEPGLSEIITEESSAPGERHEHLADHVGDFAVYSWLGQPTNPANQILGVDWILASNWLPYQRETFVTPAFAAYVSGHSTFSRAGAEVLASITGDDAFPGGPATHVVERGELIHEQGPTSTVTLSWDTYLEAAEEAGVSRFYGGIHVWADHEAGRDMGATCGIEAWERALELFG